MVGEVDGGGGAGWKDPSGKTPAMLGIMGSCPGGAPVIAGLM